MSSLQSILSTPRNKEITNILAPRKLQKSQQQTELIADDLVQKFNCPEYKPLFLKVAWRLDETTIKRHIATAFELGRNPRAYFITLVKQDARYNC